MRTWCRFLRATGSSREIVWDPADPSHSELDLAIVHDVSLANGVATDCNEVAGFLIRPRAGGANRHRLCQPQSQTPQQPTADHALTAKALRNPAGLCSSRRFNRRIRSGSCLRLHVPGWGRRVILGFSSGYASYFPRSVWDDGPP